MSFQPLVWKGFDLQDKAHEQLFLAQLSDLLNSMVSGQATLVSASGPSTDAGNLLTSGSDARLYLPPSAIDPEIWLQRLRSFNALSNPGMEINQRLGPAGGTTNAPNAAMICDRWRLVKTGGITATVNTNNPSVSNILVPGTSFRISQYYMQITLTAQQASIPVSDVFGFYQIIESTQMRELISDQHSLSLLVNSSVAGLKFTVTLRDVNPSITKTLCKLCTIPTAGVWTLIQLPALPVWAAGGNWNVQQPGVEGYRIDITLAAGANLVAPAADTWQNGSFNAAPGASNFLGQAVNSTFLLGFIQHEPGPLCTTFEDKPWFQAYEESLRYYAKSYPYNVVPGAVNNLGQVQWYQPNAVTGNGVVYVPFKRTMAKAPTVTAYSPTSGAISSVRDVTGAADRAVSAYFGVGDSGFSGFQLATSPAATSLVSANFTADTGW